MEPDDRIALHLLVALYPKRIVLVGTTVMHSYRKKVLAARLMEQLDMARIPVVQGSGAYSDDYPDIASSRAGREVAVFVLAPPTDLSVLLEESPELANHISRVDLMGGWAEVERPNGTELRSTYNWNMDPEASRQLLATQAFPITLYSSHTIKKHFSGGSLRRASFPGLIGLLETSSERLPSVAETFVAGASWDNHLMDRIPKLETVIGRENAGMQFSPADPAVIVGAFAPGLINRRTSM